MSTREPIRPVPPGTVVTVKSGIFAGYPAEVAEVWSGEDVVQVNVTVFGRPRRMTLGPWMLEPPLLPREWEWPAGTSLSRMLASATAHGSPRQLRLFAAACCRRISHLMTPRRCGTLVKRANLPLDEDGRIAPTFLLDTVAKIERFADGDRTVSGLQDDARTADLLHFERRTYLASREESDEPIDHEFLATCEAARTVYEASRADPAILEVARAVANAAARAIYRANGGDEEGDEYVDTAETVAQCDLVRDIFGRPSMLTALDPAWRTRTVAQLLAGIYEDRAFDRLPILGDALEDAGCTEEALLVHLHSPRPHVRGCWALDLLLGKR